MKLIKSKLSFIIVIILFSSCISFFSCSKSDSSIESKELSLEASNDAAEVIATSVASTNIGAMDQMEDVLQITSPVGFNSNSNDPITNFGKGNRQVTREYDSLTGWWTITVIKQRGTVGNPFFASFTNVYKVQFLNKDGQFQKNYLTTNPNGSIDTAYTVNHKIVSGNGSLVTPKSSNHLISLSGEWVVTNANTSVVTLNSLVGKPYTRITSDTINRVNTLRTLNGELTLNFSNVTGPRGSGLNWHNKTSGTITGTYHALVTFQKGEVYREKEINRNINITLGQGIGTLNLNGLKYRFHLETGDILK